MTSPDHTPADDTTPAGDAAPEVAETAPDGAQEPAAADDAQEPAAADAPADADAVPADDAAQPEAEAAETEAAPAEPEAEAAETADADAPAEAPAPAPATPGPVPRPPAATAAPAADTTEWGRVDEAGVVSVREGDDWRVVGEYPDGTPDEALAYYRRKFDDLALRVRTLEQRRLAGGASAADLRGQAKKLKEEVVGAAAVGDLAGLAERLDALTGTLAEASAEEAAAHRAAVEEAIAHRTSIVERVEALAARDPKSIQWKQATAELTAAFEEWQQHQQTGPRLPKSTGQALWKRFRDARSTVERHRRAFFAELDETHKAARDRKTRIIERAEALASKGEDGIPAYRALLDEWKAAGRAGRKVDDALWARFKAAGDALYSARAERDAAEQAESAPRIEARKALLEEAKAVADTADLTKARQLLTSIQRRWDEVGRIFPRDTERALDDQLRRIENDLRAREEVDWKRNNPETKARANEATRQLEEAIAKLETELADAQAKGDKKAESAAREALDARRAWLKAIGG
ncbi:DUF349 domain-containing protein [Microbacterium sp. MEC084]|uniref:DUF349 domain-containing protein n=1 Tax=Microbacterium sp. MEC084 TaxID=1963027 RepID=UPI00106F0F2C|nr:DUF349 domain-containing protein [Microbacterium sp. MEC084]MCD1267345.1 DUF349 domain-containing protein [Microbacterium sp. MEC084]